MKTEPTLREILDQRGLTNDELALVADVDPTTARRIVTGKSQPRPGTIISMARGLGLPVIRMRNILAATWSAAHPEVAERDDGTAGGTP
jgi:transcriptional regulator with XRE-family HTH domain